MTTTRHSHRPPHTHLLFVLLLRCLLSTSFIFSHTADTFIVTTTPNSPPTLPSIPFFPLTIYPPTILQVFANSNLQTLCAPNLVDGGSVCIGDESNQPSLDADLSSLVTGSFAVFSPCYGRTDPFTNQLNATTVCGVVPDGLFTIAGCPSMACPTPPPPS